jgi:DnaD/phage-associated family protein
MKVALGDIKNVFLHDTQVENLFIAEYMIDAPGDYVKVYLYALMLAQNEIRRSDGDIAKALSLEEDDVKKAFRFFEEMGLLKVEGDRVIIENLKEKLYGRNYRNGAEDTNDIYERSETEQNAEEEEKEQDAYGRLLNNEPIARMVKEIQTTTGRFLGIQEKESIMSLIKDLGVRPEVISRAYTYAAGKGTDSYRYVTKVVESWARHGIKTSAQADEYLEQVDERFYVYKRIMKALGFMRNPTEEERKIIDSWVDAMDFNMDEILDACAKTAGIGNPNIKYVNAVLKNKRKKETEGPSRNTVLAYYEQLRAEAKRKAMRARQEVYEKLPAVKSIEEQLLSASRDMTLAMVQGDVNKKAQLDELREKIFELEKKKTYLLTANNIPIDYMEERYRCSRCKDTGVLDTGEQCSCYQEVAKEAAAWQAAGE